MPKPTVPGVSCGGSWMKERRETVRGTEQDQGEAIRGHGSHSLSIVLAS